MYVSLRLVHICCKSSRYNKEYNMDVYVLHCWYDNFAILFVKKCEFTLGKLMSILHFITKSPQDFRLKSSVIEIYNLYLRLVKF